MKIFNGLTAAFMVCFFCLATAVNGQDILIPSSGGSGEEKKESKEKEEEPRDDSKTNTGTNNNGKSNSVKKGQSKKVDAKSKSGGGLNFLKSGKWFLEPNFPSLWADNNGFNFNGGLALGYRFTPGSEVGMGPTFAYQTFRVQGVDIRTSALGFRTFGRAMLFQSMFGHAEYSLTRFSNNGETYTLDQFPVGGGWRQSIGGNSYLNAMVLYNLLHDDDTYGSPFIYGFSVTTGMSGLGGARMR